MKGIPTPPKAGSPSQGGLPVQASGTPLGAVSGVNASHNLPATQSSSGGDEVDARRLGVGPAPSPSFFAPKAKDGGDTIIVSLEPPAVPSAPPAVPSAPPAPNSTAGASVPRKVTQKTNRPNEEEKKPDDEEEYLIMPEDVWSDDIRAAYPKLVAFLAAGPLDDDIYLVEESEEDVLVTEDEESDYIAVETSESEYEVEEATEEEHSDSSARTKNSAGAQTRKGEKSSASTQTKKTEKSTAGTQTAKVGKSTAGTQTAKAGKNSAGTQTKKTEKNSAGTQTKKIEKSSAGSQTKKTEKSNTGSQTTKAGKNSTGSQTKTKYGRSKLNFSSTENTSSEAELMESTESEQEQPSHRERKKKPRKTARNTKIHFGNKYSRLEQDSSTEDDEESFMDLRLREARIRLKEERIKFKQKELDIEKDIRKRERKLEKKVPKKKLTKRARKSKQRKGLALFGTAALLGAGATVAAVRGLLSSEQEGTFAGVVAGMFGVSLSASSKASIKGGGNTQIGSGSTGILNFNYVWRPPKPALIKAVTQQNLRLCLQQGMALKDPSDGSYYTWDHQRNSVSCMMTLPSSMIQGYCETLLVDENGEKIKNPYGHERPDPVGKPGKDSGPLNGAEPDYSQFSAQKGEPPPSNNAELTDDAVPSTSEASGYDASSWFNSFSWGATTTAATSISVAAASSSASEPGTSASTARHKMNKKERRRRQLNDQDTTTFMNNIRGSKSNQEDQQQGEEWLRNSQKRTQR